MSEAEIRGQTAVLALNLIVLAAVLCELLPRVWTLWVFRRTHNGLLSFRITTVVKSTGIALVAIWQAVVRVDAVWFNRELLGPYLARWLVDGAVWTVLASGSILVAWLYWRTIREQEHRRR